MQFHAVGARRSERMDVTHRCARPDAAQLQPVFSIVIYVCKENRTKRRLVGIHR